jgi:hypothetical protein
LIKGRSEKPAIVTDVERERRKAVGGGREDVGGAPFEAVFDHAADVQRPVDHLLPKMRGDGQRLGLALCRENLNQIVFRPDLYGLIFFVQDTLDFLGIENSAVVTRLVRAMSPGLVEDLGKATPVGRTQRLMGKVIVVADQLTAPLPLPDVEMWS